jgi:hypothetical protein
LHLWLISYRVIPSLPILFLLSMMI